MRPKENLSKEMKQRLRQEYYGLGGAENQVSSGWFDLVPSHTVEKRTLCRFNNRWCLAFGPHHAAVDVSF